MAITGGKKREASRIKGALDAGTVKAQEGLGSAKDRTTEFVDARAHDVGAALHRVSAALKEASESVENAGAHLGARGEAAAGQVEKASRYLRKNDYDAFAEDLTEFARRHVGWAVVASFAAGLVVARLGRS